MTQKQEDSIVQLANALYTHGCRDLKHHGCSNEFDVVAQAFNYDKLEYHAVCHEVPSLLRKSLTQLYTTWTSNGPIWQPWAPSLNDFVPRITQAIQKRLR